MLLKILNSLNTLLWGHILLPIIIGIGVFLTVRLNFPQIRFFFQSFRLTIGKIFSSGGRTEKNLLLSWSTASTALASTIGTGSIVGVAVAVKVGGAGALFWMWVSAFLGMAIKYTEIILAMLYRDKKSDGLFCGGPMYYLQNGLGSRFLANLFSIFCLFVSLCMGNSVQSNTISTILKNRFDVALYVSGLILTFLVSCVVLGGTKRIASMNAKLVPFMSIFYIGCCVIVLFKKASIMPDVFRRIFQEAFSMSAITVGTTSYSLLQSMKNGFEKGIFSNEAGLGSASIAHASAQSDDFVEQGAWGIFEVFFTTIIICTLTGLVVLSSGELVTNNLNAIDLINFSFDDGLSHYGSELVGLSTILFSLSTIFGWAFYGEMCLRFLFRNFKSYCVFYRLIYVIVVFLGAVLPIELIWSLSEITNGLMTVTNLFGIVFLSGKVKTFLGNNSFHS